jgi:hypothetical protein
MKKSLVSKPSLNIEPSVNIQGLKVNIFLIITLAVVNELALKNIHAKSTSINVVTA